MKILIFGDSITWGSDDREQGGWVERLKIYYFGDKRNIDIYNLGISGDTSDGLIRRFESEIKTRARKLAGVLIAIGINDSQYTDSSQKPLVSPEQFEENIRKLLIDAKTHTAVVAVVGLTPIDESKTMPPSSGCMYSAESIKQFDHILAKVCEEETVPFLPMADVLGIEDLPDGLHPNAEGHQKIFQRILPVIQRFVQNKTDES